jgi:hypothetical protein
VTITVNNHLVASLWPFSAGTINIGTPTTFTSTDNPFSSTLVTNFQDLTVVGAGVAAANLHVSTLTFVSASQATLGTAASTGVAGVDYAWGNVDVDCDSSGTKVSGTFASSIAQGAAIVVGFVYESSLSVSSVADSAGNVYKKIFDIAPGVGCSNVAVYVCLGAVASSANTNKLTVTISGNTSTGNGDGLLIEAYVATAGAGCIVVDAAGTVSNTGNSTALSSGNFSTKYKSTAAFAFPVINHTISAGTAGWTVGNANPYAMLTEYNVYSTTQSGIAATFTSAVSDVWGVALVTLGEFVPLASYPHSGSAPSDSQIARHETQVNFKPAAPVTPPKPSGSFPDRGQVPWRGSGDSFFAVAKFVPAAPKPSSPVYPYQSNDRNNATARHAPHATNVKPSVATFRPMASFADVGYGSQNRLLEAGAGSQSSPSPLLFQPTPVGVFPDAPYPGSRSVASDFAFGRFFAFVAAARNPTAIFPDSGSENSGTDPEALLPVFTRAFLAIPNPGAVYPDAPQVPWRGPGEAFLAVSKFVPSPPTPRAVFADAGNQRLVFAGIVDASMTRAFVPSPPNPEAVYPDAGNQRPTFAALYDPALEGVAKFVPAPPKPTPVYPDAGNQQPVSAIAHWHDGERYPFSPSFLRVIPAVFADQGSLPSPPAWRQPWASGLTFTAPVPKPSGSFPERGSAADPPSHLYAFDLNVIPPPLNPYAVYPERGQPPPTIVHMVASGLTFVPPIPKPSGSFPERGSAYQAPSHLYAFDLNVIPPPVNPLAVYPDFGQPPPIRIHLAASGLTFVPPIPKPSGSFPERGSAYQAPSHLYAFDLNVIPPPVNPYAVYPDRGQEPPPRVHLERAAFFKIAIPTPSGSFPERGSAYQAPSHLYAFDLNVIPPPLNPYAVYPDRGQEPPPRVHLAASGLTFVAPIPKPSGWYPDRGSGYQTPATAHYAHTNRVILPPSTFPTPVYPDVPMPSSWAQDIGDQPNAMFVFFLTGPFRGNPGDQPALVASAADQPALGAGPADAPALAGAPGDE